MRMRSKSWPTLREISSSVEYTTHRKFGLERFNTIVAIVPELFVFQWERLLTITLDNPELHISVPRNADAVQEALDAGDD